MYIAVERNISDPVVTGQDLSTEWEYAGMS